MEGGDCHAPPPLLIAHRCRCIHEWRGPGTLIHCSAVSVLQYTSPDAESERTNGTRQWKALVAVSGHSEPAPTSAP
jgi:hypothetical protein